MSSKHSLVILNEAKNQQHPFHVLGSSRLPIMMAAFVGGLAISIVLKLHNIFNLTNFASVA
jgi:hypothetical protein